MLTPTGWLLLVFSALLVGAGRVFGTSELLAVGIASISVVILSVAYVRVRQPLRITARSVKPQQVHVGDDCHARIELTNPSRLRSPVLRLADSQSFSTETSTDHFLSLDMLAAPIPSRDKLTVSYRLPTVKRGQLKTGPLTLTLTDPLGISTRHFEIGEPAEALVYPAVVPIRPPPRLPGNTFDAVRRSPMAQSGDELYGLRPFQRGDDPRRIHWRSSAHHDELIVRQFEEFSHTHTTVLLDTRAVLLDFHSKVGDGERFEAMVSAAASICRASQRRGDQVRLVTTADFDSGYGSDSAHLHKIYRHLTLVSPDFGSLFGAVEWLSRGQGGGLVVLVAAAVDGTEPGSLMSLGSHFSSKTVVLFASAEPASPEQTPPAFIPDSTLLVVDEPLGFANVWTAHAASSEDPSTLPNPAESTTPHPRP
ncbi:DUF58 domain-containing protein [Candidatus Poriferisocius sp.]|uniref:DUF58 domain-containing protein n=1 Tax=Candidatus Poriferisocius sp. TaxID=3101276 RepID=UPI003B027876